MEESKKSKSKSSSNKSCEPITEKTKSSSNSRKSKNKSSSNDESKIKTTISINSKGSKKSKEGSSKTTGQKTKKKKKKKKEEKKEKASATLPPQKIQEDFASPVTIAKPQAVRATTTSSSSAAWSTSKPSPAVSLSTRNRISIEYDRRQLKRMLRAKLKERGELDSIIYNNEEEDIPYDDETILDDMCQHPWRQREAAIEAEALCGKTEARIEGLDSLNASIQVYHQQKHNSHNQTPGLGWSALKSSQQASQQKRLLNFHNKLRYLRHLEAWHTLQDDQESSKQSNSKNDDGTRKGRHHHSSSSTSSSTMMPSRWTRRFLNAIYVILGLVSFLGFAYYIESFKLTSYGMYLPEGVAGRKQKEMVAYANNHLSSPPNTITSGRSLEQERQSSSMLRAAWNTDNDQHADP